MKKRNITYIASIATKNQRYDGERNKSLSVLDCLKINNKVYSFNLSSKLLQPIVMIGFIIRAMFCRRNIFFISKAPSGASRILNILRFLGIKKERIICYVYGLGLHGFEGKSSVKAFKHVGNLICENKYSALYFEKIGIDNISLFPSIKKHYEILERENNSVKDILNLIFFSRVVEAKGVFDIIEVVQEINTEKVRFKLDVSGMANEADHKKMIEIANNDKNITYLGVSFTADGKESYIRFNKYDLHVFPTKFYHECAPGSLVDSFIAGVPTLSTKFIGYDGMLNEDFAFLVDQKSKEQLKSELVYIFENQDVLLEKRKKIFDEAKKYSYDAFISFVNCLITRID